MTNDILIDIAHLAHMNIKNKMALYFMTLNLVSIHETNSIYASDDQQSILSKTLKQVISMSSFYTKRFEQCLIKVSYLVSLVKVPIIWRRVNLVILDYLAWLVFRSQTSTSLNTLSYMTKYVLAGQLHFATEDRINIVKNLDWLLSNNWRYCWNS